MRALGEGATLVFFVVLITSCRDEAVNQAYHAPVLEAVEGLRVGSVDNEDDALTWFRDVAIGPNEEIVTFHPQEHALRIHSSQGELIARAGGEGEGPGEFKGSGPIGVVGDTIWVMDFSTYRISHFAMDGRFVSSSRVPVDLGGPDVEDPPRPRSLFADRTLMAMAPLWSREVAAGTITDAIIYRMDEGGAATDSILSYSVENTVWAISDPDAESQFGSYSSQPFSDTELVEFSPHVMEYLRVHRQVRDVGPPYEYELTLAAVEGPPIFSARLPYDPLPISDELVDRLVKERSTPFENARFAGAPTRGRAAELARESLYRPAHHPAVSRLVPGTDGTWWVQHEVTEAPTVEWSSVNRAGEIVARVSLPRDFTLMAVSPEHAWGMISDDLDVPYLVRYDFASWPSS